MLVELGLFNSWGSEAGGGNRVESLGYNLELGVQMSAVGFRSCVFV